MSYPRATRLHASLRAAIHAGACPVLAPTPRSQQLVAHVRAVVAAAFGGTPETAHQRHDVHTFFVALTRARQALARDHHLTALTRSVLAELGVTEHAFAIDRARLRGVAPGAHREPITRDAYALHRDTWYANPRAHINLWIPLRNVSARDGLQLFPGALRRALPNDSAAFDYAAFQAAGGFQSGRVGTPAVYPRALTVPSAPAYVPAMPCAARLLFSAAQLHGPTPHDEAETRFSVDVRVVARLDQRFGRGAPSVDNASRGDASRNYHLTAVAGERT